MTVSLGDTNKVWDLPQTVEAVLRVIGGPENWEEFQTLPAFTTMPEDLRNQVSAYLAKESGK